MTNANRTETRRTLTQQVLAELEARARMLEGAAEHLRAAVRS